MLVLNYAPTEYTILVKSIIVIAHNLRSTHNVGSLLRTAEGLGVDTVYLTGYTPYPLRMQDQRLPHESAKISQQIHKTALGAEITQKWEYNADIQEVIAGLRDNSYMIVGLEQTPTSKNITSFIAPDRIALILGREVEGLEPELIKTCDECVEIPMAGSKESFNVTQAAAIALYHCRYFVL